MPITYKCSGRKRGVCDHESATRWTGRCPSCGRFYDIITSGAESTKNKDMSAAALAQRALEHKVKRISTGFDGFDFVLGGEGLVPGSTVVISGPRGTGKTTALIQICDNIAKERTKVIFVSGEMNADDLGGFIARFGISNPFLEIMIESDIEKIVDRAREIHAKVVVIDSLQKMFMDEVKGAIGSRSQGSAVAEHVTYFGKQSKTSFILVSHVTKDGELAANSGVGHEVDTLLEFDPAFKYDEDGDLIEASENLRRLYTIDKNRNGPTPREAWFRMGERGVTEISEEKAQEKKRKKSRLVLLPSATDEPSES